MQAERGEAGYGEGGVDAQAGSGAGPSRVAGGKKSAMDEKLACYAQGQFEAARNFLFGENGEEKDVEKGAELLKAAGHGGHAEAQNMLGEFYFNARNGFSKNLWEAAKWWRRASDQGDAEGQNELGNCYLNGHGVDQDDVEAARLFRLSAEQGYAAGQCNLGYCYHYGEGVDQDFEEAIKWYHLAADQGYAVAQNNLGNCYENGKGVEQNYAEAARLFQLAADQDHEDAQEGLGLLYFEGNGVQRNCDTALSLLRRSGSDLDDVTDAIAEIEKGARELLEKSTETQATMIEGGESVFGQAQDDTGDFLLHVAARAMQVDTLALLFDHSSFDHLVLSVNTAGELPRDVVSTRRPLKAQTREARALRSILSVSRRTRAACVLWCFEVLREAAPELLMACIPRDIVREIVLHVLPPAAPGNLNCGAATLLCSPVSWPRPCLAIAPPVVPQPTSVQDARVLRQQGAVVVQIPAQVHQILDGGTKRAFELRAAGDDMDDVSEPASKRPRA